MKRVRIAGTVYAVEPVRKDSSGCHPLELCTVGRVGGDGAYQFLVLDQTTRKIRESSIEGIIELDGDNVSASWLCAPPGNSGLADVVSSSNHAEQDHVTVYYTSDSKRIKHKCRWNCPSPRR